MIKRLLYVIPIAGVCVGGASTADAALPSGEFKVHASQCVSGGSDFYSFATSSAGKHNTSSSAKTLFCNLGYGPGTSANAHLVTLWAYDRHPNADVSCTAYQVGVTGTISWSSTQKTSGSGSGPMPLAFSPTLTDRTTFVKCSIPGVYNGNFSHLTTLSGY